MTKRNSNGTFAAGSSGNPSGRPRRSDQEKKVIEEMCRLAPVAVSVLENMLTDEETPGYLRMKAAEIIFDRVCGKPMTATELDGHDDFQEMIETMNFFPLSKKA